MDSLEEVSFSEQNSYKWNSHLHMCSHFAPHLAGNDNVRSEKVRNENKNYLRECIIRRTGNDLHQAAYWEKLTQSN